MRASERRARQRHKSWRNTFSVSIVTKHGNFWREWNDGKEKELTRIGVAGCLERAAKRIRSNER